MKESFPTQSRVIEGPETSQESEEKKLTLDEIEAGLKFAEDTGRLLEKAYWEDERDKYFQSTDEEALENLSIINRDVESGSKKQKLTPIEPDSTFDPEEELSQIKILPAKEKMGRLKEYKEKLAYQKEGLAKMQEQLTEIIRSKPNISFDDLLEKIHEWGRDYGLTTTQEELFGDTVYKFYSKHLAVSKIRKEYPKDEDLYEVMFAEKPKGKIQVIEGPMTLYFRCFDPRDYARIYSQVFLDQSSLTEKDLVKSSQSGGVSIQTSLIPELAGTIIAENSALATGEEDSKSIHVHEEQHAIKRLFEDEEKRKSQSWHRIINAKTDEEFTRLISIDFRFEREPSENGAKDEILALLKDGQWEKGSIYDFMIKPEEEGGLYDYSKDLKEEHGRKTEKALMDQIQDLDNKKRWSVLFWESNQKVFVEEYNKIIKNGIDAAFNLRFKGDHTTGEVIAILIKEPLSKWPKVVKRLLAVKIKIKKTKQLKQ